jgi:hypothetical protein
MKRYLTIFLLLSIKAATQNIPSAIWQDPNTNVYYYVKIDASTGIKTNINPLPNITGFIAGDVSAINSDSNYYHFGATVNATYRFYTLDLATGNIIYNPSYTGIYVGVEYNCADSTLYGIEVVNNFYNFVRINPVTGQSTTILPVTGITGYVGGTFSLDLISQRYSFRASSSVGFRLLSIDVATGVVVNDNPFPDNVVGHKFSPADSAVYGLWEDNNQYKLEKINYVNGTHSTVSVLAGVSPSFFFSSQSMNQNGEYTFRGYDLSNNVKLFSVDVTTGNVFNNSVSSDNAVGFEEPVCVLPPPVTSSLDEFEEEGLFTVFPNPTDGVVSCRLLVIGSDVVTIEVYDVFGERIFSSGIKYQILSGDEVASIDLSTLPRGLYFISVHAGGRMMTRKILIQ